MPDENSPSTPPNQADAPEATPVATPPGPVVVGHLPMMDEFHREKRTLPLVPMLIGAVLVAIGVAIFMFTVKPKTITNSSIAMVRMATQGDSVLVAVQVKFDNSTERQLWVQGVTSEVEMADGKKYTDSSAPRVDVDRFMKAFSQLAEANTGPLGDEQKISPGAFTGVSIFSYPVDKAAFEARKSISVQIKFYQWPALELKQ